MSFAPQIKIPATYMRGGTSKGVFFKRDDLPEAAQVAGKIRDQILLRVIGSPDPYAKQIDGMGGATSSTSKTVILAKSTQAEHDVDYLFGQVSIDQPFVDWSGKQQTGLGITILSIQTSLLFWSSNNRLFSQQRPVIRYIFFFLKKKEKGCRYYRG